ncbi:MAG: hypothetical protein HRT53_04940 [Colwellia sp.]|nr:hypothetical protein [Colwellia sp.]
MNEKFHAQDEIFVSVDGTSATNIQYIGLIKILNKKSRWRSVTALTNKQDSE